MFCKIEVNTWNDAILLNNLLTSKSPIWAFRGQSDSSWSLQTTFEREGQKHKLDTYFYKTCEANIITDFKRQALQHIQNAPDKENIIDWLAYIQHYGGPTRLLDFTYSFFVASFFSLNSATCNSSIWSINVNNLISQNDQFKSLLFEQGYRDTLNKFVDTANENVLNNQDFSSIQKKGNIYLVEPYNQEQRLAIQQGFFLFPTEIELPFANNLCGAFNTDETKLSHDNLEPKTFDDLINLKGENISIVKIVLNSSMIYEAINQLRSMNISNATLFPGLDGFAKSLNFHFQDMCWSITRPKL